jgi:hypothetical protein
LKLRAILTLCALAGLMACHAPAPTVVPPVNDGSAKPAPTEATDMTVSVEVTGIPLRSLSTVVQERHFELQILQLKQGGRLIFPGEDPDWAWIGQVLPLDSGSWIVSSLLAGQFVYMQLKFSPGVDLLTGEPIPVGKKYIQLIQVPVIVPSGSQPRCRIEVTMKPNPAGGYFTQTAVQFQ